MLIHIRHTTTYRYNSLFTGDSHMEARLKPLDEPGRQRCHEFSIFVSPSAPIFEYDLAHQLGSVSHFVVKEPPHSELTIRSESRVETLLVNPFGELVIDAGDWPAIASDAVRRGQAEWLPATALTKDDPGWAIPDMPRNSVLAYAQALMDFIYHTFEYVPGSTDISTPLAQFVEQRRGVCQDYAHFMIAVARSAGIPARYVSGYVYTARDASIHGADATHAWVEFYVPHANRWVGFDPTNNVIVADRHIKVAVGRDYADVPPTKGLLRPARGFSLPAVTELVVEVTVTEVEA